MRNIIWILCILLSTYSLINVNAENPYTVDKSSVQKGEYKWTMKLNNNHAMEDEVSSNKEIKTAAVIIESLDESVLHVKISDANEQRWEAPIINPNSGKNYKPAQMTKMGFTYDDSPFGFKIQDPNSNEVVVEMSAAKSSTLKFFDKLLEIGLWYSSQRVYGLGERTTGEFELCSERDSCTYNLWGRDAACPYDDGSGGCKGAYGQQPFYMVHLMKTKLFMGVLSLNSNNQDALVHKIAGGATMLGHKMIGGIFDLYFFYPKTADGVMKKYHELIGRPYMPPFWALGFHQCRYGWRTLDKVKEVAAKFDQADIPLEVMWADIDYMKDYADFTVDPVRFKGLGDFVQELHQKKMKWVPIIDAGLKYNKEDKYFIMGEANNAFIKSAVTKKTLIGAVWPGSAVFLSFYSPYATTVWHEGLSDLYKMAEYDGIWLDMNEIANFCSGECPPKQITEEERTWRLLRGGYVEPDPHDPKEFDDIPYHPGNCHNNDKTVSQTGYENSTNDVEDKTRKQYNTHSLWALFEAKATHEFISNKLKRRPFILTRANFPGSGLFTTKWLGDNHSRWEYMRYSIIGIYAFQMFGIPFVGSDMCGFMSDTNEELCARWMQMGAFYPFSRNHNDIHSRDQEPYLWEKVAIASRNALRQKYSILWYYYTKLYEVSLFGGSMVKPLMWEFPEDKKAWEKTKYMFMIGPSILIPPVLFEGLLKTWPYCPNQNWYNLLDFTQVFKYKAGGTGDQIELPAGFDWVNVLLRGGSIIPYQDAIKNKVKRTEALKVLPMELIVGPDGQGKAYGTLIVDNGISLNPIENGLYRYMSFTFAMSEKKLTVKLIHDYDGEKLGMEEFNKLTILGADSWASVSSACIVGKTGQKIGVSGSYDSLKKVLTFTKANSGINWSAIDHVDFDTTCQKIYSKLDLSLIHI
eukprot:TRINITY_DN154_c0_g2_i3.p1 TRINITY_DN154_c0_g2~~TRINITY_DN154_c0_g2_i3.p1  ORF type:complete len:917 (-),score=241.77 TRINITY_DN154_c0_g2_i3:63-2813(-)